LKYSRWLLLKNVVHYKSNEKEKHYE
jgi:hypothetical protein